MPSLSSPTTCRSSAKVASRFRIRFRGTRPTFRTRVCYSFSFSPVSDLPPSFLPLVDFQPGQGTNGPAADTSQQSKDHSKKEIERLGGDTNHYSNEKNPRSKNAAEMLDGSRVM